jgi:hypothetical protein
MLVNPVRIACDERSMTKAFSHAWTTLMDWIENVVHFVDWMSDAPSPTNKFLQEPRVKQRPTGITPKD